MCELEVEPGEVELNHQLIFDQSQEAETDCKLGKLGLLKPVVNDINGP